jgi:hypothetical protein
MGVINHETHETHEKLAWIKLLKTGGVDGWREITSPKQNPKS